VPATIVLDPLDALPAQLARRLRALDLDGRAQLHATDSYLDPVARATGRAGGDRLPARDVAQEARIQPRVADQRPHRRCRRVDRHLLGNAHTHLTR
jgi:hypothetical protein